MIQSPLPDVLSKGSSASALMPPPLQAPWHRMVHALSIKAIASLRYIGRYAEKQKERSKASFYKTVCVRLQSSQSAIT